MRETSRAEAIVIGELLAGSGRRREGASHHVPGRTRQAVRRRVIDRGLLRESFVPDPVVLGCPVVVFALAEPFAERRASLVQVWSSVAAATDVWSFPTSLFGVFFVRDSAGALELHQRLAPAEACRSSFFLDCDSRMASVPVFFDFEASWAQIAGLTGTVAYPHSLPSFGDPSGAWSRAKSRLASDELVQWMRNDSASDPSQSRARRLSFDSVDRRLRRGGWGEFRSFLEPSECFRSMSRFPDAVAFVRGPLREGKDSPELFRALVSEGRVSPFLYATDSSTVLFACLSRPVDTAPRTPLMTQASRLSVVNRYLHQIVLVREPIASLAGLVDHEYARPFRHPIPGSVP